MVGQASGVVQVSKNENRAALERVADELSAVLSGLLAEHEQLLELAGLHREAMRAADPGAIGNVSGQRTEVLQRLAALEERRQRVVKEASRQPELTGAVTLSAIAGRMEGPGKEQLLKQADRLKGVMAKVQDEHRVLRTAAKSLATHMEGLMKSVSKRLSHSGTYGRAGSVDAGGTVISALDLRS